MAHSPRAAVVCTILFSSWLLLADAALADDQGAVSPGRIATAARVDPRVPRIDGVLDDEVWLSTPVFGDFLQHEPLEGEPATEKTTFQIAYDEEALYIGVCCYDSDPDAIVSRLTRRDGETEADWISVGLDPHFDRQTGFYFTVYASGSVGDGVYAGDDEMGGAWDGVWESETAIHDRGWSAEYRIPYHVLRFSPREEYVWGLDVERHISRKQERDHWSLIRKSRPGLVSQFGRLEGLRDIHPPMHLEIAPYAMGRAIVDGGEDYFGGVGTDIRYGLTSGISLNAAINPDFGQVEADPAQLNLTAFEDFFSERRPFFVEGASIFDVGDYDLLYSRRIGRQPGHFGVPEDAEELDRPEATTILGALKLTGKTEGKTAFGILGAVTSSEHAVIARDMGGKRVSDEYRIEPLTNYLAARVKQDVLGGTSTAGLFASAVHRRGAEAAYVGAADWDLKFREDTHSLSGTLVGSRTGEDGHRSSGYIAHLEYAKRGGWLDMDTGFAGLSPGVSINDLGYLRRGNLVQAWGGFRPYRHAPLGPFLRFHGGLSANFGWNYDGLRLESGLSTNFWGDLRNFWRVHLHLGREFAAMDDDDVRRGGPIVKRLAENWVHMQVETDARRSLSFSFRPEYRRHEGGRSHMRGFRLELHWRPLPSVWFSVGPRYSNRVTDAQWVDAVEAAQNVHYVYGELESRTLDLTTRARMSFTPDLSLELFLQPFIAVGDYRNFKELTTPETYTFRPYALNENRDFHRRSLKSNLVFRWEFLPGSTLFVVWAQSRSVSLEDPTADDLRFRPFSRLRSSFSDDGGNVFLSKVSFWFGG